ncbi:MAG: bifunctional nuclease family protein [Chloroflexi bacterium]|nr:bifunctional nuclease family protein [Chloroflexota bacterium]
MQEMVIDSIRVSLMNYQRVVILKEKSSERYLPIWIGQAEADAIAVKLQDVNVPRPLTHDLLRNVIHALGAEVRQVVVSDLQSDTFFAKVILEVDGKVIEVDSRPSDALALAVRFKVPIYVEDAVLEKAAVLIDETGKTVEAGETAEGTQETGSKVKEEEIRKLSAFKDFVEGLNLEDLGKGKDKPSPQ